MAGVRAQLEEAHDQLEHFQQLAEDAQARTSPRKMRRRIGARSLPSLLMAPSLQLHSARYAEISSSIGSRNMNPPMLYASHARVRAGFSADLCDRRGD